MIMYEMLTVNGENTKLIRKSNDFELLLRNHPPICLGPEGENNLPQSVAINKNGETIYTQDFKGEEEKHDMTPEEESYVYKLLNVRTNEEA